MSAQKKIHSQILKKEVAIGSFRSSVRERSFGSNKRVNVITLLLEDGDR